MFTPLSWGADVDHVGRGRMATAADVVGGSAADLARTGEAGGPMGARRDCRRDCVPVGMSWDATTAIWFPDGASSFCWKWIHEVRGVETRPAPAPVRLLDFCNSDLLRSCSRAFSAALARLARWAEIGTAVTEAATILMVESCGGVGRPERLRGLVDWRTAEMEGERPLFDAGLGE